MKGRLPDKLPPTSDALARKPPRWLWAGLALIVLLGAYFRVGAALDTVVDYPIRADAKVYFSYAYNLRHYGVYSREALFAESAPAVLPKPDAFASPGYPTMLLPFAGKAPTGRVVLNITLVQALLGVLLLPLVFVVSRRLLPGAWSLLPVLLAAISPKLVNCEVYVLSESLFSFLLLAAIACMTAQFARQENKWLPALSGILIGLAALTRPTLQYFLPIMLILTLPLLHQGRRWRQAAWMIAGFVLVMAPWLLRNLMMFGVTSDPTLAINTLVNGHYPGMMFDDRPETLGYPYRFDPQFAELTTSIGAAITGIWARFLSHPGNYITWYLFGKPFAYFSWGDAAAQGDIFTYAPVYSPYFDAPLFRTSMAVMRLTHWIWVALSFGAVVLSFMPRWLSGEAGDLRVVLRILASVWLYFVLIHTLGFPISRYSVPLLPVVFMLSSYALFKALGCIATRTS